VIVGVLFWFKETFEIETLDLVIILGNICLVDCDFWNLIFYLLNILINLTKNLINPII